MTRTYLIPNSLNNDGLPDAHSQVKHIAHADGTLERTSDIEVKIDYHISNLDGTINWQDTAEMLAHRLIAERMQVAAIETFAANLTRLLNRCSADSADQSRVIARKKLNASGRTPRLER